MKSRWFPQLFAIAIIFILLAAFADIMWGWVGWIVGIALLAYLLSLR